MNKNTNEYVNVNFYVNPVEKCQIGSTLKVSAVLHHY